MLLIFQKDLSNSNPSVIIVNSYKIIKHTYSVMKQTLCVTKCHNVISLVLCSAFDVMKAGTTITHSG